MKQLIITFFLVLYGSSAFADDLSLWYKSYWTLHVDTIAAQEYNVQKTGERKTLAVKTVKEGMEINFGSFHHAHDRYADGMTISLLFPVAKVEECFAKSDTLSFAQVKYGNGDQKYFRFRIKKDERSHRSYMEIVRNYKRGVIVNGPKWVDIKGFSEDYIQPSDSEDLGDRFRRVLVESDGVAQWIDGRCVFCIYESNQCWEGVLDGRRVEVKPAEDFSIPAFYEGILHGFVRTNMLVFIEDGKEHLIQLTNSKPYSCKYLSSHHIPRYLTLDNSENNKCRVNEVVKRNGKYEITITNMSTESFEEIHYDVDTSADGSWTSVCSAVIFYGMGMQPWYKW